MNPTQAVVDTLYRLKSSMPGLGYERSLSDGSIWVWLQWPSDSMDLRYNTVLNAKDIERELTHSNVDFYVRTILTEMTANVLDMALRVNRNKGD